MELLKYINGVLFIDDKRDDVDKLYAYFEKYNIPCMYINPNDYNGEVSNTIGFARFVFLDIEYMNGTPNLVNVVSLLRDLAEKGMKNIVLIMWTLHEDYIEELTSLLVEKMRHDKPILIFNAKKSEYIDLNQEQYGENLERLFQDSIKNYPLVFKMLEWEKCANVAAYKTFNDIMSLSYNNENNEFNLSFALSNMASQNIPSDKISSAFDSANDMLVDRIRYEVETIDDIDLAPNEDISFLRKLNYYMMFVLSGLKKEFLGNIYFISELNDKFESIINSMEIKIDRKKIQPILVDLTPGCSFAHSDNLILLNGIIVEDVTDEERRELIRKSFFKESFLKDVYINNNDQLCCIIIDFLGVLTIKKDEIKEQPSLCLKEGYRVSLQQKFGNYLGRIGDNIYHK